MSETCPTHGEELVKGFSGKTWCESCLRELVDRPLESTGLIGRDLEETYHRVKGHQELEEHLRRKKGP